MNDLERLEAALRAAHAAGDDAAAARFAQAIRALQASSAAAPTTPAAAPAAPTAAPAPAAPVAAPAIAPAPVAQQDMGAGRSWEPAPRVAGQELAKDRGVIGAAMQGMGSSVFGLGTPAAAADEYMRSRVDGGTPRTWQESLEFARGLREGSKKEHPVAYAGGFLGGMAGEAKVIAGAVSKAPAVIRNVFALQKGQTVRNLARLSATGAATAATTATMQEGTGATLPAAAAGAVLGPAAAGAMAVGSAVAGRALSYINPDNAAIRVLSKKLGESADAIAARYNNFTTKYGRRPLLAEIMTPEAAGEMGQIAGSKVGVGAARTFQKAEAAATAARPGELRSLVEQGGRTTTVPEQTAELAPITENARSVVNSRVRSTETAQLARRDNVMDSAMERIRDHLVPVSEEIQAVLEHPDIQGVLPGPIRRRLNSAIADGKDLGSINIPVSEWERMRFEMAKRAGGPGASQIYSQFRDRIRDYVSERVPEYAAALKEFGRRSAGAEATTAAEKGVAGSAREFADMLRAAGDGVNGTTARATTRVGVRNWLSDQLSRAPQDAERVMGRLVRDNRLRANLRATLSDTEMRQLDALGEQYGHRLNIIEGVKVGTKIMTGDSERFADAVRTASEAPGGAVGARAGARGTLAARAGESPASAVATARAMAENPGLQERLTTALGGGESARLQQVGAIATRAAENLSAAAPRQSEAQLKAMAQAKGVQEVISGLVMAGGRASGAFRANFINNITQRTKMSKGVATRLAEMATDPKNAHTFIDRMRAAGIRNDELLRWYQAAAGASGIATGATVGK